VIDVTQVDQRVKDALLALLDSVEREDEYLRLQQMREFKKNNLFWHGFQYLFWSDTDQDWRIPTHNEFAEISGREETRWIFDYVVNHFKAHGEAIIAALSTDIPNVRFGPRDAQDPEDRRAVTAADSCADLIEKWNRAKLLIIEALFYLATEGFVASYTYNRKDDAYGKHAIQEYGTRPEQTSPDTMQCPNCGQSAPASAVPVPPGGSSQGQGNQEQPGSNDPSQPTQSPATPPVNIQGLGGAASDKSWDDGNTDDSESKPEDSEQEPQETDPTQEANGQQQQGQPQGMKCSCGEQMQHVPGQVEQVPYVVNERFVPKGREVIEIYGPLNVRVPAYVTKQADAGYLLHYVDADPALFQGLFLNVADEISSDPGQDYERLMRQSSLSMDGYQLNIKLATQKKIWFRLWMLNRLKPEFDDIIPDLVGMFSTGIYASFIGQTLCELRDEAMDKHWTITKSGPSKGVHADPLLKSLVPLQELRNNMTNLFVMQVEYGVPSTYADTEVFDFEGQSKQEVAPGYIYPVTPRPGQNISDAFYTERTSTLNKESTQLLNTLTSDEQFVIGSFPSIFGGPSQSGSKTLGEYDKSRSFALQRLGLVYYFIDVWWGETIHKSVLSFIDHQLEDEPLTQQTPGGFQTKWIRKADMKGSFDRLEPDPSSDFPVSFAQKRQTLMSLVQLNNPQINQVLFSPENAGFVQQYVGLTELQVPSEGQRRKQIAEILVLIQLEPQEVPVQPQAPGTPPGQMGAAPPPGQPGAAPVNGAPHPMMPPGQPKQAPPTFQPVPPGMPPGPPQPPPPQTQMKSTVPIEPDIDDDKIHIDVLTDFLIGDTGQDLKQYNMPGYSNCMAHLLEHKQHAQMVEQQNMQQQVMMHNVMQPKHKGGVPSDQHPPKPQGPQPPEAPVN
jgi:hypothetical protein